jgi:hypothetical protein
LADRAYRAWLLAALLWCAAPASASADWYFTPFIGWDFNATTTLADLDYNSESRRKTTFGGSVAFIKGILGLEADYALVPAFFRKPSVSLPAVAGSRVQTFTGSLIVTTPLSLTRESLRPYVLAGLGWLGASSEIFLPGGGGNAGLLVDEDMLGISVGGGAIGMFSNRTGVRFDLRRVWHLHGETAEGSGFGTELKFWRGTIGFTLRY